MSGADPYGYMQTLARQMPTLQGREAIEQALDEMEYLFEVIPPELQDNAERLIAQLRDRLSSAQ